MKNATVQPASWGKTGLAVLPGVWLIFQQNIVMMDPIPAQVCTFAVTAVIVLGIVLISLFAERRLAPWCLPALGALLWKVAETVWWLHYARRSRLIPDSVAWMVVAVFAVAAILLLYFVYRKAVTMVQQMPRLGWGLLCLLVVATIALEYSYSSVSFSRVSLIILLLLTPVAMGWPLAQRDGLSASLLVATCEPAWIEVLFNPRHAVHTQLTQLFNTPHAGRLEVGLFLISYLPFLCFSIIIPVGLLHSRSERSQLAWLILPPFLALVGMNIIRGLTLAGTTFEYSSVEWLRYGIAIIQLLVPLLLSGVLYHSSYCRKEIGAEGKRNLIVQQESQ